MVGRTLGHYRLLERIGSGGMGVVYRAHDERLEREVAVKVLPPEATADATARARLIREARHAASLNHPNICTIHEVGEAGNQAFIVMELIQGEPLSDRIGSGLPPATLLDHALPIADALAHAHARGVVHRDLKSSNVMVTSEDRIKVLDFGLARRATAAGEPIVGTRSLTESGNVVGTPAYLAPEVIQGQRGDMRSDVWAFGVLLHEMASGSLPFAGRTVIETGVAILHAQPAALPDSVPERVCRLIACCLEKDPSRRFTNGRELRDALQDPTGPSPRRRSLPWQVPAAAATVLILVVPFLLDTGRVRSGGAAACGGAVAVTSLAVLPLENLSRNPEEDYFADGMTEELITELTKIGALKVIAASSVQGFRGTRAPIAEVGRRLKVGAVVLGSVMRSGDRVRINARLVEAPGQRQLWAESYERGLRDVLGLQGEVALAIAAGIHARLTPGEKVRLARASPVDPAAYRDVLRGRHFLKQFTPENFARAQQYFDQAITRDPAYAPAYAAIADRYYEASSIWMAPHDAIPRARAAALQALALDSTLAEAHCALATLNAVYEVDLAAAEHGFRRAIELNPGYGLAHHRYGYILSMGGRHDEAIARLRHAVELDPLSPFTGTYLGLAYHFARRYEDALRQFRDSIALDTAFFLPHVFQGMT